VLLVGLPKCFLEPSQLRGCELDRLVVELHTFEDEDLVISELLWRLQQDTNLLNHSPEKKVFVCEELLGRKLKGTMIRLRRQEYEILVRPQLWRHVSERKAVLAQSCLHYLAVRPQSRRCELQGPDVYRHCLQHEVAVGLD